MDTTPTTEATTGPPPGAPDLREFIDSPDAMVWAEAFVAYAKEFPELATDVGSMVGWFANAMAAAERNTPAARAEAQAAVEAALAVTP